LGSQRLVKQLAHTLLSEVIKPDDVVIDASMGNGHDTVFFAGVCKNVFAFDVQDAAIEATRERLNANGLTATLIKDGHENIDKYVKKPVKAAIFNLGYLPGSDKQVITKPDTTVQALVKISKLLVCGGRIVVTVYPGHEGGKMESDAVMAFVEGLDRLRWKVDIKQAEVKRDWAPYVICIASSDQDEQVQ